MHIDNGALVGTYVSDRYSEKGTVTIVLTDGDSTPTREYTRYKYVQTEQLTAIGVAVKDYGAVLVPEITLALFTNGMLNAAHFGIFVKFNDECYNVSLSTLLATNIGADVTFEAGGFDSYPTTTFNATLPPYNTGNAGQVPTVDENGKVGWDDIPEELPPVTGNTGKFLGVNDGATGVEWKNVPNELPTIGDSDAGKVLKVNAEHSGTEWGEIQNELPTIASGDAGKVLKVNAGETGVEWGAAGGGIYIHRLKLKYGTTDNDNYLIFAEIISKDATQLTSSNLYTKLSALGVGSTGSDGKVIPAYGRYYKSSSQTSYTVVSICLGSSTSRIGFDSIPDGATGHNPDNIYTNTSMPIGTVSDTVVTL